MNNSPAVAYMGSIRAHWSSVDFLYYLKPIRSASAYNPLTLAHPTLQPETHADHQTAVLFTMAKWKFSSGWEIDILRRHRVPYNILVICSYTYLLTYLPTYLHYIQNTLRCSSLLINCLFLRLRWGAGAQAPVVRSDFNRWIIQNNPGT